MSLPGQAKSVVDITLCSPHIASRLYWEVTSDTLVSDHFPIQLIFETNFTTGNTVFCPKCKWNIKKADWETYSYLIDDKIRSMPQLLTYAEKYVFTINCINEAAEGSIPTFKPFKDKTNKSPAPWWTLSATELSRIEKHY